MASTDIVVVGSCMIDFVSYTSRLPKVGETIHGSKFVTNFGGKGANQCVAAAKLGGKTTLVARVGDDIWGEKYIENLKRENVNTEFIKKTDNSTSGIAQIIVSEAGENQIVIVAGANAKLNANDVISAKSAIERASVVILQLETSVEVAIKTLELSKGISILNGAPALSTYDLKLLTLPTIFCVNETEAAIFTGLSSVNNVSEAETAARHLIGKGCNSVLITLGPQGAIYLNKDDHKLLHVSSPKVQSVDTTGAGDAFIGALAFVLANQKGVTMEMAMKIACHVAADSVTRAGTQISFPNAKILPNIK
ncbi:unnamed protein product [Brassicogethes aeneus]|uniref:Ribokinase n=1 Tax=Brassicogethes aeneus TaxID=1431903 RepID=A0A9P0BDU2_BRAAE|nr:unnamed protein product [Brassicogethes aeneus]